MSTSLILGIAGAAALGPAGLAWGGIPQLGMSGAAVGFLAGSTLGSILFAPNMPDIQGPRMGDLKVQTSTYGSPIPIYYGTARGAGQVLWSTDYIETAHEEEAGGKGGPTQSYTSYTYSVSCAIAICEGPIDGVRRIWANNKLIYDISSGNSGATGASTNVHIFTGEETQTPSSLQEAYLGAGNVPAYRGLAYVEFENLQLADYGNRIPNFTFEIICNGTLVPQTHVMLSNQTILHMIPHPIADGIYLATSRDDSAGANVNIYLHVIDPIAKTDRRIGVPVDNAGVVSGHITYVDSAEDPITGMPLPINEIWVCTSRTNYYGTLEVAIAFDVYTMQFKRRIIPSTYIGVQYVGMMEYDKANRKVLFGSSGTSISEGCNYLDPYFLSWSGVEPVSGLSSTFTSKGANGENSICLGNFYNEAVFFNGGYVKNGATGIAFAGGLQMAYDSKRNRYACYSRQQSGFDVYRVFDDDGVNFPYTDIVTTTTRGQPGAFDYWPIADKFLWRAYDNLCLLNADTFEVEINATVDVNFDNNVSNLEIPGLPEYCIGYANAAPTSGAALIPLTNRLSPNAVSLSSIVADICSRVGLSGTDIDVSQLTDSVDGYTIAQRMSARAAIDGLQAAFFFDAVESD